MLVGGADKICFVIAPGKSDILEYYGAAYGPARAVYVVQPSPSGLCDAIFRAEPVIGAEEPVVVGLPDTVWFPQDALCHLPDDRFSFLLFPVPNPQLFDAVLLSDEGEVREIQVKRSDAATSWIWGAFKMPGATFHRLRQLWIERERRDEYVGGLVNAYLAEGGTAIGVKAGKAYADVGTLEGYRGALKMLSEMGTEHREPTTAGQQAFAAEASASDACASP
jgi:dTDP-glucose pyrophosphorylase